MMYKLALLVSIFPSAVLAAATKNPVEKKIGAALDAVKLMQNGVSKYLGEKDRSAAASEKILKDMLENFKVLENVLDKVEKKEKKISDKETSEIADMSTQLKSIKQEDSTLKANDKDLQITVQKLVSSNEDCKAQLDTLQKSCAPGKMSDEEQGKLLTANKDLKDKNEELSKRVDYLNDRLKEVTKQDAEKLKNMEMVEKSNVSLKQDKDKLLQTVQGLLHNDVMAKLNAAKTNLKNEKAELESEFKEKSTAMQKNLMEAMTENKSMKEDMFAMKNQFTDIKMKYDTCSADVANLKKENSSLQKDKSSIMQSMQTILRQNTAFQDSLVKQKLTLSKKDKELDNLSKLSKTMEHAKHMAQSSAALRKPIRAAPAYKVRVPVTASNGRKVMEEMTASDLDIQTMGATSKIDEYTTKAEIAIAEIPKKSPLLADYLGLPRDAAPAASQSISTAATQDVDSTASTDDVTQHMTHMKKVVSKEEPKKAAPAAPKSSDSDDEASKLLEQAEAEINFQE